jgi:hypothetical protein
MRFRGTLAAAVIAMLGLLTASQGSAAELGIGPRQFGDVGRAVEWREGYYADCSRHYRGVLLSNPYDAGYGPNPNSSFLGPIGYHCYGGTYAFLPTIVSRCRTYLVSGPTGWVRVRRCN